MPTELFKGPQRQLLSPPQGDWGGRAAVGRVDKLAAGERFAGTIEALLKTTRVLDRIYGRDMADQPKPAAFLRV